MKITLTCEIEVLEYKKAIKIITKGFLQDLALSAYDVSFNKSLSDKIVVSRIVKELKKRVPITLKEEFEKEGVQIDVRVFVEKSSKQV